jgi:hypothetical protein
VDAVGTQRLKYVSVKIGTGREGKFLSLSEGFSMQRKHRASRVLAIAVFAKGLLGSGLLLAEERSDAPMTSKMVAGLQSRNKEPRVQNPDRRPAFDAEFDWTEQRRVWKAIKDIIVAAASEWDSLTANIENESYCITIEGGSGSFYNWAVGDVCRIIISRTLSEAYFRSLDHPMTKEFYGTFRRPEFTRKPKKLKEWLHARREKTLAQLQADACDWAIDELSKRDDKDREGWVLAIRETANKLRDGGEPILWKGFGAEELWPCKSKEPDSDDPFADDPKPSQN